MNQAKVDKYRNCLVQIPSDLANLLSEKLKISLDNRSFVKFLNQIHQLLASVALCELELELELVVPILDVLPKFGPSSSPDIHKRIQTLYKVYSWLMPSDFLESQRQYVRNTADSGNGCFVREIRIVDPNDKDGDDNHLPAYPNRPVPFFKADDEGLKFNNQHPFGFKYFCDLYPMYPLSPCEYPKRAGVYSLFYLGKDSLFHGFFPANRHRPVYVGMSESDIQKRIRSHVEKITSSNLRLCNFGFRFVLVENPRDAPRIEKLLIHEYHPPWNCGDLRFCFGNGHCPKNLWNKAYVQQDPDVIKRLFEQLAIHEPGD